MYKLSKFKIFTVVFIALFIFAVAAMYTNTKDASEHMDKDSNQIRSTRYEKEMRSDNVVMQDYSEDISELNQKVNALAMRVQEVVGTTRGSSSSMKCQIEGIIGDRGYESLSPEAALEEAKENGKDIVLTCSFK